MSGIKIIASNKKARHDYEVIDSFEAGMVLCGSEVKALRAGNCTLKDSYVSFKNSELIYKTLIFLHMVQVATTTMIRKG